MRFTLGGGLAGLLAAGCLLPLLGGDAAAPPEGSVVINEIMYHPPDDLDELQYVELHNRGTAEADLSGWKLRGGPRFDFPRQTRLAAGGLAVVCRNGEAFRTHFGGEIHSLGVFAGALRHSGAKLELVDAQGKVVDTVAYSDKAPWPLGADGYGSSLERICPGQAGSDPGNWASSAIPKDDACGGSPGRTNTNFSATPPPQVTDVRWEPAEPGKPITVNARVSHAAGVEAVTLEWGASTGGPLRVEQELGMTRQAGDARQGDYRAQLPAQPEGSLVRFAVRARGVDGTTRRAPGATEPRRTYSCATFVNTNAAHIPFLKLLSFRSVPPPNRSRRVQVEFGRPPEQTPPGGTGWSSAAIYIPPDGGTIEVHDYVQARPRKGGLKVHFLKDQPLAGMTGINVIFESAPRYVLSEPLAYELFRRLNVPSPASGHVRLWVDDRPLGYYLLVEQPNRAFLRRQGRDPDGNLYKLLWYERDVVRQHEKKTNTRAGHEDLLKLLKELNGQNGAPLWEVIQQRFNVDEMIDYFVGSMCIQNWDGFWNNYYAYHSPKAGGKWEMIPWDEDKTWGDFDGCSQQYDWYSMPLTFGMRGGKTERGSFFERGPFGGTSWWRPPGYFSGPLLADPEFRRRFLDRLREVCETVFTPATMDPIIDAMAQRLEPEIAVGAELRRVNPEAALAEFRNHIRSFHDQVQHRRQFILDQLGAAPAPAATKASSQP